MIKVDVSWTYRGQTMLEDTVTVEEGDDRFQIERTVEQAFRFMIDELGEDSEAAKSITGCVDEGDYHLYFDGHVVDSHDLANMAKIEERYFAELSRDYDADKLARIGKSGYQVFEDGADCAEQQYQELNSDEWEKIPDFLKTCIDWADVWKSHWHYDEHLLEMDDGTVLYCPEFA